MKVVLLPVDDMLDYKQKAVYPFFTRERHKKLDFY